MEKSIKNKESRVDNITPKYLFLDWINTTKLGQIEFNLQLPK